MHSRVILRCACAVDATEQPNDGGRGFVLLHACGQGACPARTGDGVCLRACSRRAFSGNFKYVRPAVEHREKVITVIGIRQAQNPWFLANIHPGRGVKRICIGCCYVSKRRAWVFAYPGKMSHWSARAFGGRDVGHHPAGVFHRHQRITVNIGLNGFRKYFKNAFLSLAWAACHHRGDAGAHEHQANK